MKTFIKFSIIIPSYNQAEFLPYAIESALNQTFPKQYYEVIVIDDGSTDGSLDIARGYKAKNYKVVSQVNKGLASARNAGIMNATGDYILPLDADDILMEGCLHEIQNKMDEERADVIAPSFRTFGVNQIDITLMEHPKLDDFRVGNRIPYCSAVRRQALLDIGGYSPRMAKGYEDLHLWYNLLSRGYTITTIPKTLFLYRVKEESMITESVKHHDELMAQINKDFPNENKHA
jgi:glycosyltransferase involved in cell wall biosynthesis